MQTTTMMLLVASLGLALGGCETAGNIFNNNSPAAETTPLATAAPPAQQTVAKVALAPIIGAPEPLGQQLRSQLTQSAERSRIGIVADRDSSADFGMRGYLVAARDKGGVKVSYIWDVTDPSGKRVNRITGEEIAPAAAAAKDPWGSVTPAVTQTIADKVASSLGTWAPTQPKGTPVASAAPPPTASGVGATAAAAPAPVQPATPVASATPSSSVTNTATGALPPPAQAAAAPVVTGAPGDGNSALATALAAELARSGGAFDGKGYQVEGKVSVGEVNEGKQAIRIDWRVKDAKGNAVGTVTQKNAIPPGSLDGAWGKTAEAAAAAAAQGIVKLLPQQAAARAVN